MTDVSAADRETQESLNSDPNNKGGMMDSIETKADDLNQNSDDSIELDKSQSSISTKSRNSSSASSTTGNPKKKVTKKMSKEYLIQNLNGSQHEKIKISKKSGKQSVRMVGFRKKLHL